MLYLFGHIIAPYVPFLHFKGALGDTKHLTSSIGYSYVAKYINVYLYRGKK